MEDLFLHYAYTARNVGGSIVQFCYGDDGMNPTVMEEKIVKQLMSSCFLNAYGFKAPMVI